MSATSQVIQGKNAHENEMHKMHALISITDRMADDFLSASQEVSYSQLIILFMLDKYGSLSQNKLSKCLGLTEAAVSKQIENMSVKGFLVRQVDPTNRRQNQIFLTENGKKNFISANLLLISKAEEFFKVLSIDERAIFNVILDKLLDKTKSLSQARLKTCDNQPQTQTNQN